jgi:hypothetical protein
VTTNPFKAFALKIQLFSALKRKLKSIGIEFSFQFQMDLHDRHLM